MLVRGCIVKGFSTECMCTCTDPFHGNEHTQFKFPADPIDLHEKDPRGTTQFSNNTV